MHICIDDALPGATTSALPEEKAVSAVASLNGAADFYGTPGITVTRLTTGHGLY